MSEATVTGESIAVEAVEGAGDKTFRTSVNRASSLFYILGFSAYALSSVIFPVTHFGGDEAYSVVAMLVVGAVGTLVAIGVLALTTAKARRLAGAALGFSL